MHMRMKMEAAGVKPLLFLLFTITELLSLALSLSSDTPHSLQYQSLLLNPLPSAPPLSWPQIETGTEAEVEEEAAAASATFSDSMSLDLQHVDALLAHTNTTPQALFHLRLQRDVARVESISHFASLASRVRNVTRARNSGFSSSVISGLSQGSGEYFTRLGVGTPPRYLYMVLDTGSDIVWMQCAPCRKCYSQTDPVFNPANSRSYASIPCASRLCHLLDSPGCRKATRTCLYEVSYGDGSFTIGDFSTETLTFHGTRVGRVALGCGHDNEGLFIGAAGLLGLGRGKLSFPRQAGRRFNRLFSYCLVDRSASSRPSSMIFGSSALYRTARFTPLLRNPKLDTFYYVELLGVSVGGTRVPGITASLFKLDRAGNGGVIIDCGTSVTRLIRPAYIALRDAFKAGASNLKPAPEFSLFDTCFDLSGKTVVKVPTVVLHFRGADVSLPASNYLIPVDRSGRFCFAFAGTMSGLSIVGNIQQQGFRVVYDLARSRIGFAPRGCA